MRGVVFTGGREVELMSFEDPTPGPGEVVLEIKASGMCGSDLKFYRAEKGVGPAALGLGDLDGPVIAGHEPCGVVVAIGSGVPANRARMGQRVMVHHYKGCGACEHCLVGWSQMCDDEMVVYGATGNGGHAPYMKVPASTLVPLTDSLTFSTGAAISCGTGTAYNALKRIDLGGRDKIAIFGQGPVGLAGVQLSVAMGARVAAVDISPERLAFAEKLGAEMLVNATETDPVEAIMEWTGGRGVDKSLDASGAAEARAQAVRSTKKWGTACYVGEGGHVTLDVSKELIRKQMTIVASWTFSAVDQADCARFVADRELDADALFTHRYDSLDQATGAYELFDTQTTGKGVFLL